MTIDYLDNSAARDILADVCIVGAGPAGLSIASALADTGADVCILESGTWTGREATQDFCAGESIGTFDLDPAQARMRAFGGSARVWGGGCMPLEPMDLESRDWVPGSGWPINYDALAPYYQRARRFFGIDYDLVPGGFSGREACTPLAFADRAVTTRFSASSQTDFRRDHRKLLEHASGVRLVLNATVVECNVFESGGAVESVSIRTLDGRRHVVRARHFVLACGGIENARLLLLSNGSRARGLGNDYDQVGRRFMDHPTCRLGAIVGDNAERVLRSREGPIPLYPQACLSEDGQRALRVLNARVRLSAVESEPAPGIAAMRALRASLRTPGDVSEGALLEHRICEALDHCKIADGRHVQRTNDAAWRLALRTGLGAADILHAIARKLKKRSTVPPARVDLFGHFEQAPNPQSRVTLGDGIDAFGQRRVCVDWRLTDLDLHTFRTTARVFGDGLARVSGARFEPEPWIAEGGAPPGLFGTAHHMGTTRMSDDPRHGVVDRNCGVHGVDNLFVAGSSVFPTGGWAFPTFTIGALGLRLAEHLSMRLAAETGSSLASDTAWRGNDALSLQSAASRFVASIPSIPPPQSV
ncbi:MAG: GMC family oxidoreductase [Vicinamibacterales bacterium]